MTTDEAIKRLSAKPRVTTPSAVAKLPGNGRRACSAHVSRPCLEHVMSTPLFCEVDCRHNAGITTTLLLAPETVRVMRQRMPSGIHTPYASARSVGQ